MTNMIDAESWSSLAGKPWWQALKAANADSIYCTSDVGNCLASLFCVVAQIHTGAGCTKEVTLKAWGREEDDGFDVRCTGMAESTLIQEQRFQLVGPPIGQQQGIGDVPSFMRLRPGTRIARDAAGPAVDFDQIDFV